MHIAVTSSNQQWEHARDTSRGGAGRQPGSDTHHRCWHACMVTLPLWLSPLLPGRSTAAMQLELRPACLRNKAVPVIDCTVACVC